MAASEYFNMYNMSANESDLFTTMEDMADMFNESIASNLSGMSNNTGPVLPARPMGKMFVLLVKVVYTIGIVGNACAIIALRRGERRVRNRKHLLLLTSLAANDLVALVSHTALLFFY